jgi:hypothetical protein
MSEITGTKFVGQGKTRLTADEETLLRSHIDALSETMAKLGLDEVDFKKPPMGGKQHGRVTFNDD